MIFIDNKYTRLYYSIINHARTRKNLGYVEVHHIIPKSIGGSNDKENLIELTAKEHFICHRLLTKMTKSKDKRKMTFAAWALTMRNPQVEKIKISSRTYSYLKEQRASLLRGVPLTEETKKKLRKARSTQIRTEEMFLKISKALKGRKQSEETKRKRAEARRGSKHSPETILKMKEAHKNKPPMSKETKQKIREARARQDTTQKKVSCPHCGKVGGQANMTRYHFNNCKFTKPL